MSESAPRISDEAKAAGKAAVEALYDRGGTAEFADTEEIVDAVTAAILPLLCGGLEEERDEADQRAQQRLDAQHRVEGQLEQAREATAENGRLYLAELNRADGLQQQLNQVREEVERAKNRKKDGPFREISRRRAEGEAHVAKNILAILDSSSSDESSGVGTLEVPLRAGGVLERCPICQAPDPSERNGCADPFHSTGNSTTRLSEDGRQVTVTLTVEEQRAFFGEFSEPYGRDIRLGVLGKVRAALGDYIEEPATTQKPQDEEER